MKIKNRQDIIGLTLIEIFPPYPKITCKSFVKEVVFMKEGSKPAHPMDSKNKFCSSEYE